MLAWATQILEKVYKSCPELDMHDLFHDCNVRQGHRKIKQKLGAYQFKFFILYRAVLIQLSNHSNAFCYNYCKEF